MIKLLIITPFAFHDKVGHAGGKILNFNFKQFSKNKDFDLSIAYIGDPNSDYKLMKEQYPQINCYTALENKSSIGKAIDWIKFKGFYPLFRKFIPLYFISNGFLKKRIIQSLKKINFSPDVVIVEYTQIILWINLIQKRFPNAKFIASCHDVTSQLLERKIQESNFWFKKSYQRKFVNLEMGKLEKFNEVITFNSKDTQILRNQIKKPVNTIAPFYDVYVNNEAEIKDGILFWGAMYRSENMDAVRWFVENVWTKFCELTANKYIFYVVGGGVKEEFRKEIEVIPNVKVLGFVSDPTSYFSKAFSSVVPLRLGAGIKIKVIEAMASGIPVLTNKIGIEGIPATEGKDFYLCQTPQEYIEAMTLLCSDQKIRNEMINNAKQCVLENFNLEQSIADYTKRIFSLVKN